MGSILKEQSNIRSWGFNIVWRNSESYRYLRFNIFAGKQRFQFDFFRKEKFL